MPHPHPTPPHLSGVMHRCQLLYRSTGCRLLSLLLVLLHVGGE